MSSWPVLSTKKGFLGIPEEDAVTHPRNKVVVVPFGLESSVSYGKGTANGPQAIIDASHEVELFDEVLWSEPFRYFEMKTLTPSPVSSNTEEALNSLTELVSSALALGAFPMVLGGEHSITPGIIRSFQERFDDIAILQFDAHADLRDGYMGNRFSHAAAMRRCLDYGNIRLVSVGIRNISAEEARFIEANPDRISIFWAKDKVKWNIEEILSKLGNRKVYLTFDVDAFDMSIMLATGTPEPNGLMWQEAMDIISAVSERHEIIGADVNELSPIDGLHACNFVAAKLVYKILSYAFKNRK
ncbi:agmatinase [Rickettsiales endosymbiont of Peranema trichophorum]|uniref:agmatinase n=1 Tax=Rickettsiales endosymbiont of Peranema trichophorum TaxID=2486577 RepID=UPI001022C719|nr:agmatinase [Rickettsiales endosymbiont of Peranema trichophorum]RZI47296.1 agmatinase [Rickettsiales endosymbiont of Peranema trichophorum]